MTDIPGLWIFAVIYGLDWFATVPPTIALIARNFGKKSVGTIYGFVFMAHQIGAGISSSGGGLVHDLLGDYQLAFLAGGVLALCGALMSSRVRVPRITSARRLASSRLRTTTVGAARRLCENVARVSSCVSFPCTTTEY